MAGRKRAGRKPGKASQALRVVTLYDRLLNHHTIYAAAAAEELGVSLRQMQLDLKVVRECLGARLEVGDDGGLSLPRQKKRARDRDVAVAQVLALELGARLSHFLWDPKASDAIHGRLDRLRDELFPGDERRFKDWRRRVAVVAPGYKDYGGRAEIGRRLTQMLRAMVEKRPVDLTYLSFRSALAGESPKALRVHPLGLVLYREGVYFIVDVVEAASKHQGRRIYLTPDRMVGDIALLAGVFEVPKDFNARAFVGDAFGIMQSGTRYDVSIEIDAAHSPWIAERQIHSSQVVEPREDGTTLLKLRVAGLEEIDEWILSLGEHAEVTAPIELRDRVRRRLRDALDQYAEGDAISLPAPRHPHST